MLDICKICDSIKEVETYQGKLESENASWFSQKINICQECAKKATKDFIQFINSGLKSKFPPITRANMKRKIFYYIRDRRICPTHELISAVSTRQTKQSDWVEVLKELIEEGKVKTMPYELPDEDGEIEKGDFLFLHVTDFKSEV